jgi:chromosome segregation ATPase
MDTHSCAMVEHATTATDARVVELEAALASAHAQVVALRKERDQLRASHARLREELELLKRRIFVAKAERVDTAQLEMEFADKLRQLDALAGTLGDAPSDKTSDEEGGGDDERRRALRAGDQAR